MTTSIPPISPAQLRGAGDRERRAAWVGALASALDQGMPGAYVNFVEADGAEHVSTAYPDATLARLARVKARVDPTNLFHRNHTIRPASA